MMSKRSKSATLLLLVAFLVLGGLVSLALGQDDNWDFLNYHFYNPWAFLNHRFGTDLYTAGLQSYFSPILDLPYYIMSTRWFFHAPRALAFIMGLPFGAVMFLSFLVSWSASAEFELTPAERIGICLLATAFGGSGTMVISQAGTTTNEIQIAVPVIAALLFILAGGKAAENSAETAALRNFGVAGFLTGLAAALKLTAITAVPAPLVIISLYPGSLRQRFLRLTSFCLAWWACFLVVWGPWGFEIYRLTKNPLYPFMNQVFTSSWSAPGGGRDLGMIPTSLKEALLYPFYRMSSPTSVMRYDYYDPRYAILLLALFVFIIGCLVFFLQRRLFATGGRPTQNKLQASDAIILFYGISYVTWEAVFSISRYTVALEGLSGAVLMAVLFRLHRLSGAPARFKDLSLVSLMLLSGFVFLFSVYPQGERVSYGKTVFSITAPTLPRDATVVLVDSPTAFLAPLIWQKRAAETFIGIPNYVPDAPGFKGFALEKQINERLQSAKSLYIVYSQFNVPLMGLLSYFNLAVSYDHCQPITTNISANELICPASYGPVKMAPPNPSFQMVLTSNTGRSKVLITPPAECAPSAFLAALVLQRLSATPPGLWAVYVQTPLRDPILIYNLSAGEKFKTGTWVHGGDNIIFTTLTGHLISEATLQYQPCRH